MTFLQQSYIYHYNSLTTSMRHPLRFSDFVNALHLVNYHLKRLSEMLQFQGPLTMYVARHSWTSAAKAENVPLSVISEGMGHDSEATTQISLASLETSVVDKANRDSCI